MNSVLVGISIGLFVIAVFCTIISIVCVGIVVGFKNSTHRIEYMNPFADEKEEEDEEEIEEAAPPKLDPKVVGKFEAEDFEREERKKKREFEKQAALAFIGKAEE